MIITSVVLLTLLLMGCEKQVTPGTPIPGEPNGVLYTLSQIQTHDTEEDCWMVIQGRVYDVTEYVPHHPANNALLQGCGIDADMLFETRPMGSGRAHSLLARTILSKYDIGELQIDLTEE